MPLSTSGNSERLRNYLEEKYAFYHSPNFIANDPLLIPHLFSQKQDIEISGFFAAILAWGNRTTIIRNCKQLFQRMDNAPYQFVIQHEDSDLKPLLHFVHRTFNATDLFYLLHRLQEHYRHHSSLETAFQDGNRQDVKDMLIFFHQYIFKDPQHPERTRKHIATPARNSACKRLNMFLRWMVRQDDGLDFGIWKQITPAQLICPLDVHVGRVAYRLGLTSTPIAKWSTAYELTAQLRKWDADDPARFDFALFGLGREEKL